MKTLAACSEFHRMAFCGQSNKVSQHGLIRKHFEVKFSKKMFKGIEGKNLHAFICGILS
jgi:hypothetical protein